MLKGVCLASLLVFAVVLLPSFLAEVALHRPLRLKAFDMCSSVAVTEALSAAFNHRDLWFRIARRRVWQVRSHRNFDAGVEEFRYIANVLAGIFRPDPRTIKHLFMTIRILPLYRMNKEKDECWIVENQACLVYEEKGTRLSKHDDAQVRTHRSFHASRGKILVMKA